MPQLRKVGIIAIAALVAQLILTWFYSFALKMQTQTLFSISPYSGYGGTQVGDKIVGYLTGLIPFDLSSYTVWIAMLIGAFALTWAGFWLYEQKYVKLWQGNTMSQRIVAIILYGHVVMYLAFLGLNYVVPGILNVPNVTTTILIGLAINTIAMSTLLTLSAKYLKFPRF